MFDVSADSLLENLLNRIAASLQLTDTQHALAISHYEAVGAWLSDDPVLRPLNPRVYPQGSFAIGTTVKPLGRDEYDLDLVVEVDNGQYTAIALYNAIQARLAANGRYQPEKKKRCLRLSYEHQFHMDILPGRPDTRPNIPRHALLVPDRELLDWKETNPRGYAEWFEARAKMLLLEGRGAIKADVDPAPEKVPFSGVPPLKRTAQLLKRWREVKWEKTPELAPISVVLTTLSGYGYGGATTVVAAMDQVLNHIVAAIPAKGRLVVVNPTNPREDFSEKWDTNPKAYAEFVAGILQLHTAWQEIRNLGGQALYRRLQELFGTDLTNRVLKEHADYMESLRSGKNLGVTKEGRVTTAASAAAVAAVAKNRYWGGR